MRNLWALCIAATAMLPVCAGARAADACGPNAIGISRTIEIDATGGPRVGGPHGDPNLLRHGEVVLTFDDGPVPGSTETILKILAAHCIKATFFTVGKMAAAHPRVLKEVADDGHTVGSHTWSHANLKHRSWNVAQHEIESAFAAANKALPGQIAPFFRYPYLSASTASEGYLRSRNIAQISIDVDTLDWRYRTTASIVAKLAAGLAQTGRGIILLHDIHNTTAVALPAVIEYLSNNGYKIVHLVAKSPYRIRPSNAAIEVASTRSRKWSTTISRQKTHE